MSQVHPLQGPNKFKLGVFSANADGGLAITDVPERWRARWVLRVPARLVCRLVVSDCVLRVFVIA